MNTPAWFVQRELPSLESVEPADGAHLPPASKCRLEYLNEGGANFVFRILPHPDHGQDLPLTFHGKLLRLQKDDPHIPSAEHQLRAVKETFQKMFPAENLLEHDIISLDAGVLHDLNEYIGRVARPPHREGDCIPKQLMSGLLVTDMTLKEGEFGLHLKPKWLAQSPNAPQSSKRCRTCALRAYRASERTRTATDAQETCPLALVSERIEDRTQAVQALTSDPQIREYVLNQAQLLLQQLRVCQIKLDQQGVLNTSSLTSVQDLCKAMTLRDCSLFIKRSGNTIDARLGDLDLKQPEKLSRWKAIETSLISDGWYTNTERETVHTRERICLLSRCQS